MENQTQSEQTEMKMEGAEPIEQPKKEPVVQLKAYEITLPPIHLACLDDELRPNLKLIQIKNNIASATNGSVLVKIDLSMTTKLTPDQLKVLDGKYIHMNVFKEMCKCDTLELDYEYIVVGVNDITKIFQYSESIGEFFNMDNIILNIKEAGEQEKRFVCYNSKYIAMLSKIFGSDTICFSFSKGANGTLAFPEQDSGMFAVIMPIAKGNTNRYFFI